MRPWPGNVRELRGAVRQAADDALARPPRRRARRGSRRDRRACRSALRPRTTPDTAPAQARPDASTRTRPSIAALGRANGVVSVAARALGLHRTQLYRLMDKYGIARENEET